MGEGVSTLAPNVAKTAKERKAVNPIISKVVRQIAHQHLGQDVLYHVYCAGLWHGSQLAGRHLLEGDDNAEG